jgi:hypothetical protein
MRRVASSNQMDCCSLLTLGSFFKFWTRTRARSSFCAGCAASTRLVNTASVEQAGASKGPAPVPGKWGDPPPEWASEAAVVLGSASSDSANGFIPLPDVAIESGDENDGEEEEGDEEDGEEEEEDDDDDDDEDDVDVNDAVDGDIDVEGENGEEKEGDMDGSGVPVGGKEVKDGDLPTALPWSGAIVNRSGCLPFFFPPWSDPFFLNIIPLFFLLLLPFCYS